MQNIKLHEATKQFNLANKLAMFFLEKKGVPVKSHSSAISMEQLELLRDFATNQEKYANIIAFFNKKDKGKDTPKPVETPAKVKIEKKAEKTVPTKKEAKKTPPPAKPEKIEPVKTKKIVPENKIKEEVILQEKKPIKKEKEKDKKIPTKEIKIEKEPTLKPKIKKKVEPQKPQPPKPKIKIEKKEVDIQLPEMIQISDFITVKELAETLKIKLKFLEDKLKDLNKDYMPNQFLNINDIKEVCQKLKVEVDIISFEDYNFNKSIEKHKGILVSRPPVVTIMGHVDHGKTTLLDTLRNTRIADKEHGGITQKIGAYSLATKNQTIIFIDTPGHEAFSNLRARGTQVTDIVILMVAADDGIQPQTLEAINHAQAAKVPMIVAINKIDKNGVDPMRIKQELTKQNIIVEEWGGDVVCVEISAKFNKNLDALLEMILLVAEMQELKAYKNIPARGSILESRLDAKLGPIATVMIQHGELKRGDVFICGNSVGKVKIIFDDRGKMLNSAKAVIPVEIMGFDTIPESGQIFQVLEDVDKAKKVIELRKLKEKYAKTDGIIAEKKLSLKNLFEKYEEGKVKVFSVIIKADNFGSLEVLEKLLLGFNQEKMKINIVYKGIGHLNDSDILLASTSNSLIVGFNVKVPQKTMELAKREKIEIRLYNVIYHLIEDLEKAIKGEIEPEYMEVLIGKAEVLQKFKISKLGIIAGCIVKEGKVNNKVKIKVMRKNDFVFEGDIETLKRVKDQVTEVKTGQECGIKIKNFNDIEEGDILEFYEQRLKK